MLLLSVPRGTNGAAKEKATLADGVVRVTTTTDSEAVTNQITKAVQESKASDGEIEVDEVDSFYFWEGKVQHDPERRISFNVKTEDFDKVEKAVSAVHNYDLPMLIYEPARNEEKHLYWRGWLQASSKSVAEKVAQELVENHVAACVQVKNDGWISVKTTDAKKGDAAKLLAKSSLNGKSGNAGAEQWIPIGGSAAYLHWLDQETGVIQATTSSGVPAPMVFVVGVAALVLLAWLSRCFGLLDLGKKDAT